MIRAVAASTAARAAARIFQVIESTKDQTAKALRETGSVSASKRSPRESPLEQHAAWLLGLIAEEPDLKTSGCCCCGKKRSRSALARSGDFMTVTASGSGRSLRVAEDLRKAPGRLPPSLDKS
jgi:hypothetical protein